MNRLRRIAADRDKAIIAQREAELTRGAGFVV